MKIKNILALAFGILLVSGIVYAINDYATPTNDWQDFYGYIKGAKVGDIITAKDPNGVIAGKFIVNKEGRYGILHVYGDDSTTTLDEGAKRGEVITFYLNDRQLKGNASWKGGREITMLNLSVVVSDKDGDGVNDEKDLCSNTEKGKAVDKNGCSAKQFCELIKINLNSDVKKCESADWKANEAKKKNPQDCEVQTIKKIKSCVNRKNAD